MSTPTNFQFSPNSVSLSLSPSISLSFSLYISLSLFLSFSLSTSVSPLNCPFPFQPNSDPEPIRRDILKWIRVRLPRRLRSRLPLPLLVPTDEVQPRLASARLRSRFLWHSLGDNKFLLQAN